MSQLKQTHEYNIDPAEAAGLITAFGKLIRAYGYLFNAGEYKIDVVFFDDTDPDPEMNMVSFRTASKETGERLPIIIYGFGKILFLSERTSSLELWDILNAVLDQATYA